MEMKFDLAEYTEAWLEKKRHFSRSYKKERQTAVQRKVRSNTYRGVWMFRWH